MGDEVSGRVVAAVGVGVAAAIALPSSVGVAVVVWERLVALSLVLACALLLVASAVVALASGMRARSNPDRAADRLLTLADAFLISAVGVVAVEAVFLFVLAVLATVG